MQQKQYGVFSLPVIVGALGFFVDIYDLLLFTIVKKPSMLGVGATDLTMLADSGADDSTEQNAVWQAPVHRAMIQCW